ncbi:N-acetylated-alpha-linked acidic dipeptidase 2-like isoform X2 [Lineus longissimus]|uniref:N-acetylated-alpha-linked acidic dipeptidase 2-like isoform X2 n=1 Tax=Lineus longissimus TaxID=88925 RepID=UPI002B4DC3C6
MSALAEAGEFAMPSIPGLTRWNSDTDRVDLQYKQMDKPSNPLCLQGWKGWIIKILILLVFLVIGVVVGYLIRRQVHEAYIKPTNTCPATKVKDYSSKVSEDILSYIHAGDIREKLKSYSKNVHIAGIKNNNQLMEDMKKSWVNAGLDDTKVSTYNALLSYPDPEKPNLISVIDANGTVQFNSSISQAAKDNPLLLPYSAYAPNGTVEGELVYANYGTVEDFKNLKDNKITVKGKIVLMRYGRTFRGDKIEQVEQQGAIGAILYTDPSDYAKDMTEVWPNGWWIPGDAVQQGNVRSVGRGDPLTPHWPSIDGAYRIPESDAALPKIPVQPIGYSDAYNLMRLMKGPTDNYFKGAMNVSYGMGPGFKEPNQDWKVRLEVNNYRERRNITNIIGYIRGSEEPDRYVIIGNHRDAWSYGAQDPGSGTAVLSALVAAFGKYHKQGEWQPRRTIIFANWDAEEFGLIGSYEWIEEHAQELTDRAVAYLNMDSPIKGNYIFAASSSPLLKQVIYNSTMKVPCVDEGHPNMTVFERWSGLSSYKDSDYSENPQIRSLGAGSDQTGFLHTMGIPSMYPTYRMDKKKYGLLPSMPFYHTRLDIFDMIDKFVDPGFRAHEAYTKVMAEALLELAEAAKLPLDIRTYVDVLESSFKYVKDHFGAILAIKQISLDSLRSSIDLFKTSAADFLIHFNRIDTKNVLQLREVNDRLLQVSRAFVYEPGLPGSPQLKNLLLAPSKRNWYRSSPFPGMTDTILDATTPADYEVVRQQVSILTIAIKAAERILAGGVVGIDDAVL